jgi:hypothetical protein
MYIVHQISRHRSLIGSAIFLLLMLVCTVWKEGYKLAGISMVYMVSLILTAFY